MLISGKVSADGKEDLLDALHRPRPDHGRGLASVVGSGAHLTLGGLLLVGGVSQRMVSVACPERVPSAGEGESNDPENVDVTMPPERRSLYDRWHHCGQPCAFTEPAGVSFFSSFTFDSACGKERRLRLVKRYTA